MKITRIKPPKYKVGKYSLNEYELRQLMVEVAKGEKASGLIVKDEKETCATIKEDGALSCPLFGMNISSAFTLEIIRLRRSKHYTREYTYTK